MNKRGFIARATVGVIGGALLVGGAGAAIAAEVGGGEDVDVNVNIEALEPVGALTLSVASGSTTLAEVDSGDEDVRQFDGTLPTVTVSDDRAEVPAGLGWYVLGQASALTATGGLSIGAENLGWTPKLLTDNNGEVSEGPQVDTEIDGGVNGVGLVGQELLTLAPASTEAAETGTWEANAHLFLKTPADVAPGAYSGTITLTLWEDDGQ